MPAGTRKILAPSHVWAYAARVSCTGNDISAAAQAFLASTEWRQAIAEPLSGDASARRYWRLRLGDRTAVLMDASAVPDCLPPFIRLAEHLRSLGLSAPEVWAADPAGGCAVVEDFGDATFSALLDGGHPEQALYLLATEVLITLHQQPCAIPKGWRVYDPQRMLADIELYLDWPVRQEEETVREKFRQRWLEVLPVAHRVPQSLLLRDYHVANLMWLPAREGVRRTGLLDFQDAYAGPVTYDLVSLLKDARRDVHPEVVEKMKAIYLEAFPGLDRSIFTASLAILAALRHTRVLAIFARLAQRDGKPAYQRRHAPRVRRLLGQALQHPVLAGVREWFESYGRND